MFIDVQCFLFCCFFLFDEQRIFERVHKNILRHISFASALSLFSILNINNEATIKRNFILSLANLFFIVFIVVVILLVKR